MKKFCIIFLSSIIISVTALGFGGCLGVNQSTNNADYLRIHIRADSNTQEAQAVKYVVKDEIVTLLTPRLAKCADRDSALETITNALTDIEERANATLKEEGFPYFAKARVQQERFPTRKYGEYTLPAGEYTALIIELGEGAGDNWWCVVYPPLCFTECAGTNVVYKSKIVEIIERWKRE